jgi:hypothetical protein
LGKAVLEIDQSKNKNCLWQPCLLMDQNEMSNVYRGPGSIYGRCSIKIAYFVPIRSQKWPPKAILVSYWLISKKSSPLKPLGQMI